MNLLLRRSGYWSAQWIDDQGKLRTRTPEHETVTKHFKIASGWMLASSLSMQTNAQLLKDQKQRHTLKESRQGMILSLSC